MHRQQDEMEPVPDENENNDDFEIGKRKRRKNLETLQRRKNW